MKTLLQAAALSATLSVSLIALFAGTGANAAAGSAQSVDGRWDAVLSRDGVDIPFRLDIKGQGQNLKGVFYDGFKPYDGTTSASFQDGKLTLNLEHYLTTIDATLDHGRLSGELSTKGRASGYTFAATRHVDSASAHVKAPAIAGNWVIPLDAPSSKGEKAFRFVVEQHGPDVAAAILRIDGDTGSYSGSYLDGKWV
ncbi:MAG TPA: hypothetical protein VFA87_09890, partial [Rhizomicrobium sp.]|nr:hypothetical protein [Rhizomicrobium sp.]